MSIIRKILVFITVLSILKVPAFAEIQDFKYLSANVPEGWTAVQEGATVAIVADDQSGSIHITASENDGTELGDIAADLALRLGGDVPLRDEDGDYMFDFNDGMSHVMLTGDDKFYILLIVSGVESAQDTLSAILDSIEIK